MSLWGPPLIYMALIFHLSSQSDPLPALTEHVWDKVIHTAEYGVLAALLSRALVGEGLSVVRAVIVSVVLTAAYGATDEWHQLFTPGRQSDLYDWIADLVGSVVGVIGSRVATASMRDVG